jgi:hypothetical protein
MGADFTCWEHQLGLNPQKKEDIPRFQAIIDAREPPTPAMEAFLAFLLARFPEGQNDDGVWKQEPVRLFITGPVMCFGVVWSKYREVRLYTRPAARKHGLDFYDHQSDLYIPASAAD